MFHLFEYDHYYPCGGVNDYVGSTMTRDAMVFILATSKRDADRGQVASQGQYGPLEEDDFSHEVRALRAVMAEALEAP